MKRLTLICCILLMFSCEDVIDVELDENVTQLVVDAWLNNKSEPQHIHLTTTLPYFESTSAPRVTGATVFLTDDFGNNYTFLDNDNDGTYTWTPNSNETLGQVGTSFVLTIDALGETYQAFSTINRVPPVDSVVYEFDDSPEQGGTPGIYAEFFAKDILGIGDAYWIKTWKNGEFLNLPRELNIAFDASFTVGSGTDGITFITPIRENVNPRNENLPPYEVGDSITVEIHSLTLEAFLFLEQSFTQMTLGDNSIFAPPPANVPTNIENIDASSNKKGLGFFNVSAVNGNGVRVN